jgi:hypothetical protein
MSDTYVRPAVSYERRPLPEVRWIDRDRVPVLQQLYEDGWGNPHWVDVPMWASTEART